MSIPPEQEQAILEAARNNDDCLGTLLKAALESTMETMDVQAFDRLCDTVHQILTEAVHEARGWKDETE